MVPLPDSPSPLSSGQTLIHSLSSVSGCRLHSSSQPEDALPQSLACQWVMRHWLTCSKEVQQTLLNSRKDSTKYTYLHKWKRCSIWCVQKCCTCSFFPLDHPWLPPSVEKVRILYELYQCALGSGNSLSFSSWGILTLHPSCNCKILRGLGNSFSQV